MEKNFINLVQQRIALQKRVVTHGCKDLTSKDAWKKILLNRKLSVLEIFEIFHRNPFSRLSLEELQAYQNLPYYDEIILLLLDTPVQSLGRYFGIRLSNGAAICCTCTRSKTKNVLVETTIVSADNPAEDLDIYQQTIDEKNESNNKHLLIGYSARIPQEWLQNARYEKRFQGWTAVGDFKSYEFLQFAEKNKKQITELFF